MNLTESGPGVRAISSAEAAMAPNNCARQKSTNRTGLIIPTSNRAKLTFGLNRPPVTRKNNQADTSKLNPIAVEVYMTCSILEAPP